MSKRFLHIAVHCSSATRLEGALICQPGAIRRCLITGPSVASSLPDGWATTFVAHDPRLARPIACGPLENNATSAEAPLPGKAPQVWHLLPVCSVSAMHSSVSAIDKPLVTSVPTVHPGPRCKHLLLAGACSRFCKGLGDIVQEMK